MKKLFIVDSQSPEAVKKFIDSFRVKAPNIIILDYQNLFNTVYTNMVGINKTHPLYAKTLSYLDTYMFKYNRKEVISIITKYIDSLNTPRSIIFFICNHKPVVYHLKRSFNYSSGKANSVKVVKFVSNAPKEEGYLYNKSDNPILKHDIEILISDINNFEEVKTKGLYFYNSHIPIKLLNTL